MKDSSRSDEVGVLIKSMNLLVSLADGPLSVVKLSERTGVSKPTVYRILNTLDSGGFVIRDPVRREYSLGPALIGLGRATRNSAELIRRVRPYLRELHDKYNETINLGVLSHGKIIYLDILESRERLRVTVPMVVANNYHTTALGKAILAAMPEDSALKMIDEETLPMRTRNTLISQEQLLTTIRKSRSFGYAIDNEEDEIGFRCVAAPILNSNNFPIAAISVTAPTSHRSLQDFATIGQFLIGVCSRLKKTIPISF
jgi:DNA-binding IclR family transcriptional regulator